MIKINETGPSIPKTPTIQELNPSINMRSLTLTDVIVLKNFLEKGRRECIFSSQEFPSIEIIHTKLGNIIEDVAKNNKFKNES